MIMPDRTGLAWLVLLDATRLAYDHARYLPLSVTGRSVDEQLAFEEQKLADYEAVKVEVERYRRKMA